MGVACLTKPLELAQAVVLKTAPEFTDSQRLRCGAF
jgi:hypothetical protein